MPYLPPGYEAEVLQKKSGVSREHANILADLAGRVRLAPSISRKVSTRQLLTAAENIAAGDEMWRAVSTVIGHYNDANWRQQVMEVFQLVLKDPNEVKKWQKAKSGGVDSYVQLG